MQPDDNPPVGLLLCTEYGQEMVEYLTPFTDPQLFVARYELQLPSKEKIRNFLMQENGMRRNERNTIVNNKAIEGRLRGIKRPFFET
jgi:hypothetical protein